MHSLLQRQLLKAFGTTDSLSPELEKLLEMIAATYEEVDLDRVLLERALELTSEELLEANQGLRTHQVQLEKEVESRTAELFAANRELRSEMAERILAEEARRESDQRYRALAENSPTGIFHSDQQGRTLYVNKAWSDITGLSAEDALGDGWQTAIHPVDRKAKLEEWGQAIDLHRSTSGREYRILRPDGTVVWVEGYAVPLTNEQGDVTGYVGSVYDITSHKEAAEIILESEEKYRTLFEESNDVIYISTPEGRLLDINPAGVELFEYESKEDLLKAEVGNDLYAVQSDRQALAATLEAEGVVRNRELALRTKTGGHLTVLASATAVKDRRGKVTAFRGILRDVTSVKQLERELRQGQKMEAIGRLAGGVAHDFNNLLTAIIGYADLLVMNSPVGSSFAHNGEEIKEVARRGASLTQQLLSFSRRQATAPKTVSVNATLLEMKGLLGRLLGEGVELVTHLEAKDPAINADPTQLEQIVLNLALNARDAMPEGGRLGITSRVVERDVLRAMQVRLDGAGPWVRLSVSDTGSGIPEDIQEHIFEPFFSTKPDSQGTGLGLSTVYGAVKQNGGAIQVRSETNKGTTFDVFFPVEFGEPDRIGDETAPVSNLDGNETILIAEDEPAVRSLLENLLRQHGYNVLAAANGHEALELARSYQGSIDLLVSDIMMPKLNGIDLARTLREEVENLRIVLLTGYSDNETALAACCDSYLIKPFAPRVLAQRARQVLDGTQTPPN